MFTFVQAVQYQFGINDKMMTLLEIGFGAMAIFFIKKVLTDFEFENLYFKFFFSIFIFYQLILIIRGIKIDYQVFKFYFQTDYIFYPLIIPLVIFFNKNDLTFFYVVKFFYFLAIAFLFLSTIDPFLITQRGTGEPFILPFAFTCGFLFLNAKYFSKKINWIAFLSLVIGFISFIYLARRNAIGSFGALLFTGIYFMLRNLNAGRLIRLIPLFVGFALLALSASDMIPSSLTSKLNERISEDSRSYVFYSFFKSLKNDMVFGKGMKGTYYCPINQELTDDGVIYEAVENRDVIENGYLQLILNGGYVNISLFVLILLPAAILGIFKSKNQLTRACGAIIFLWMVDMFVYGMPRLLMQYILVWMSVSICYKKSFRDKTDDEISESFAEVGFA